MKEVLRVFPVPAGDVSGICSALYELGGMIVMHDPSGCNSTYNTHDELRWYRKPADIFISGFTMRDIVLGRDQKLVDDTAAAFEAISPRPSFIALCNSPLPYLNGTDFEAICRAIQARCGVPCFYVPSNGMHDYTGGVGAAWLAYAQSRWGNAVEPDCSVSVDKAAVSDLFGTEAYPASAKITAALAAPNKKNNADKKIPVNLLGLTPLDYANPENVTALQQQMHENGFQAAANWAYETSPESVAETPNAEANLVLSAAGLPLAHFLEAKFGIPYVVGAPVPGFAETVFVELRRAAERQPYRQLAYDIPLQTPEASDEEQHSFGKKRNLLPEAPESAENIPRSASCTSMQVSAVFIGEAVLSASLSIAWMYKHRSRAYVLCPFEKSAALLPSALGKCIEGEEDLEEALKTFAEAFEPANTGGKFGNELSKLMNDQNKDLSKRSLDLGMADKNAKLSVFADPLYAPLLPANCELNPLPSLAVSGRIHRASFPNFFQKNRVTA